MFVGASTITNPGGFYALMFVPANKPIAAAAAMVKLAGTVGAGGRNGYAVYDITGVLLGSTPDDNNLWTATGWAPKAFTTPIAAAASDRYVYVGAGCAGYTGTPNIAYCSTNAAQIIAGTGYQVSYRRAFYDGASSWPASFNPASYGNDPGGFLPLIALA